MNKTEFETLSAEKTTPPKASVEQLKNKTPRTLLFGYTLDRATWHVYLGPDQKIHQVSYSGTVQPLLLNHVNFTDTPEADNHSLLPSKRAYPELCDFEFAVLLATLGESVPYTTFTDRTPEDLAKRVPYAGLTAADLAEREPVWLTPKDLGTSETPSHQLGALYKAANALGVPHFEECQGLHVLKTQRDVVLAEANRLLLLAQPYLANVCESAEDFNHWISFELGLFDARAEQPDFGTDLVSTRFSSYYKLTLDELQARLKGRNPHGLTATQFGETGILVTSGNPSDAPARIVIPDRRSPGEYLLFEQRFATLEEMQTQLIWR